jgi:hypothetical protein
MRIAPVLLILILPLAAQAVTIERAWAAWREASHFDSLGEHFTGREVTGGEIVLRSTPAEREGFYLLLRVKDPAGNRAVLEVIAPGAHTPVAYSWDLPASGKSSQVYQFGVTGADWPHAERLPMAWRIRILGEGDTVLAERASFLWSVPQ